MPATKPDEVDIPIEDGSLPGFLGKPGDGPGLVVFAHGSGSSRMSPRNRFVAEAIRERGLGTLLFDLLTEAEDRHRENRFDIELLTDRLLRAVDWVENRSELDPMHLGLFGSSTGAAAALRAASSNPDDVDAVVSRGGRVDLAAEAIPSVTAATLFIVGGADTDVLRLNRQYVADLSGDHDLHVVEGAGHLFEGEGELEEVATVAADWFERWCGST